MNPFYFGSTDKPLFGLHHQPVSSQFQDTSIVICNPIGYEYGRAHSAIRSLAIRLSSQGYHVLCFDYFATGDSSGKSDEVSMEQCIKDIELSCEEIKAISATRKVTVIGYRIGATFAAYASRTYKFNKLVLWDPIVNGDAYLNKLQLMHTEMLRDDRQFSERWMPPTDKTTELLGYDYKEAFRCEIKAIDLKKIERVKSRNIDVFCYKGKECDDLRVREDNFLTNSPVHEFSSDAEWDSLDKISSKILADQLIDKIVEVVG